MQLTKNFDLDEFIRSDTAKRHGIDNNPTPAILAELQRTAEMLELVRVQLGNRPIWITSGYRALALNSVVGGSVTSAHCRGMAADFTCPDFGTPLQVCRELATFADSLKFDQLIHEFGSWVHIGRAPVPRKQLLTIDSRGTRLGLMEL